MDCNRKEHQKETTVLQELLRLSPYTSVRSDSNGDYINTNVEKDGKLIPTRAYIKRPLFLIPTESGEHWDMIDEPSFEKAYVGCKRIYHKTTMHSDKLLEDAKMFTYESLLDGLILHNKQPSETVKMNVKEEEGMVTITCYCKVEMEQTEKDKKTSDL